MDAIEDNVLNEDQQHSRLRLLLEGLFSRLDDAGTRYCVLRNYEELPYEIGNDIDLFVHRRDITTFDTSLRAAGVCSDWTVAKNLCRLGFRSYWMVEGISGRVIHIDVVSSFFWKGIRFLDGNTLLATRKCFRQFYIPDASFEAALLLIKDLIEVGKVRRKYAPRIQKFVRETPKVSSGLLRRSFGQERALWIEEKASHGLWDEIDARASYFQKALLFGALARNSLSAIGGLAAFCFGHVYAAFTGRAGIFLAIIGPDGSGKSTLARNLKTSLAGLFPIQRYYHGHFGILPELKTLKVLVSREKPVTAGKGPAYEMRAVRSSLLRKTCDLICALVYLVYYSLDYWLGHFVTVRCRGRGELLVFDRYFYDYLIQPQPRGLPKWLVLTFARFLPRPDVLLYLKCPPHLIHERKPELPAAEIKRQQEVIEDAIACQSNCYEIDTARDCETVVRRVYELIVEQMKQRCSV